jgi:hypothetical protein
MVVQAATTSVPIAQTHISLFVDTCTFPARPLENVFDLTGSETGLSVSPNDFLYSLGLGSTGERARPLVHSFFVLDQMNRTEPNRTEPNRTEPKSNPEVNKESQFIVGLRRNRGHFEVRH